MKAPKFMAPCAWIFWAALIIGCAGRKPDPEDWRKRIDESPSDFQEISTPKYQVYDRIAKSDTVWIFKQIGESVDTVKYLLSGATIRVAENKDQDWLLHVIENDSIIGEVWKFGGLGIVDGKMTALKTVNVRSGRGTKYKKIGQLTTGDEIKVDSLFRAWYRVPNYNGKIGYVHSDYLSTPEEFEFTQKGVLDLLFTLLFNRNFKPVQVFDRYFWEWEETRAGKRVCLVLIVNPQIWRFVSIWDREAIVDAAWEGFYNNLENERLFRPEKDPSPRLFIIYENYYSSIDSISDIPLPFLIYERTLDHCTYTPISPIFDE